ncbi:ATP12 family protein, partial [Klebsiella pneumoniae]
EWDAQNETIDPTRMHKTQLAATAIDRVAAHREAVIEEVAAYGGTDLLCYRAESPATLVERQQTVWQPHLDWCAVTFDAP